MEWSRVLGVGPDDLPSQTRLLVEGIDVIHNAVTSLRMHLHECPDRALDPAPDLDLRGALQPSGARRARRSHAACSADAGRCMHR